jgi:3-dehydroquinate synthase
VTSEVNVRAKSGAYKVYCGSNAVTMLPDLIMNMGPAGKIFLITNKRVDAIYGEKVWEILKISGRKVAKVSIEDGERYKNPGTVTIIADALLSYRCRRNDLLVVFGGGVTGDIGGFTAGILLRGIPYVHLASTLLAQVDSSIGGKVGVNHRLGKNLIGLFYQPRFVISDTNFLCTLDLCDWRNGMTEVIKYAFIRKPEMLERILGLKKFPGFSVDNIDEIVHDCIEIKARIVEEDEFDQGIRVILNYGHTFGHAIETYFKHKKISHGEAVSIGMVAAAKLSRNLGYINDNEVKLHIDVLNKFGLPVEMPKLNIENMLNIMDSDKKHLQENRFVILKKVGKPVIVEEVGKQEIISALR